MIEIRRLNKYTYDLFLGVGYDGWSRVRQGRSSTFVLEGQKLSYQFLKAINSVLHPQLQLQAGNRMEIPV